jgi:hypothetical protein
VVVNPHDPEAQWSTKRTLGKDGWHGYKAQVCESVEDAESAKAQAGAAAKADDLMRRLAVRGAVTDPCRLPAFAAAHKHPWLAELVARRLLDTLPPPGGGRIAAQLVPCPKNVIAKFSPACYDVRHENETETGSGAPHIAPFAD